jgi:hypothetical protein
MPATIPRLTSVDGRECDLRSGDGSDAPTQYSTARAVVAPTMEWLDGGSGCARHFSGTQRNPIAVRIYLELGWKLDVTGRLTHHPPVSRDLPRGEVTLLFTDIEGSTKLLETRPVEDGPPREKVSRQSRSS